MTTQFNLSGNRAGIQGHSQGHLFPVVLYWRGDEPRAMCQGIDVPAGRATELKHAHDFAEQAYSELLANNGFTLAAWQQGTESPTGGYCVGIIHEANAVLEKARRTDYRGREFRYWDFAQVFQWIWQNFDYARAPQYLGGWIDGELLYLDRVEIVPDLARAIQYGRQHHQQAIYCAETGQVIATGHVQLATV